MRGGHISTRNSHRTGSGRSRWTTLAALIATAALLAGPSSALAQQAIGPAGSQYDTFPEQADQIVGVGVDDPQADEPDPAERDRAVAALPFTGLDLAFLALAAGLLGLSGFAVRRFTGTPTEDR